MGNAHKELYRGSGCIVPFVLIIGGLLVGTLYLGLYFV